MNFLKKNNRNLIFSSLFLFSSSTVQAETPTMEQIVILQSAFNRCMLEEKLLTKKQLMTMTSQGAEVNPELFNPVMEILENGGTKFQKEGQDIFINKLGGCKNYLRTFKKMIKQFLGF